MLILVGAAAHNLNVAPLDAHILVIISLSMEHQHGYIDIRTKLLQKFHL